MKITKTRYEAAKKKLLEMQKHKQVVEDWNNAVKDCPIKDQISAVSIKDGVVKLEIENRVIK
ncbi:MAG: hypothetical protein K0U86_06370 [Planctomycetes bacterium]|nr:hypothetical protein [Planctomycetota bacterium]MCH9776314.1 hypothetical protein [Planctomycetota bacterium]MCH9789182.1 hypothetical protein [Planctomycetota bacterium]